MGGTKINFFLIDRDGSFSKYSIPTNNPDDFKNYIINKFSETSIAKIILDALVRFRYRAIIMEKY